MIGTALALRAVVRARPGLAITAIGAVAAMCALSWCWGLAVGQAGIPAAKAAVERQCGIQQKRAIDEAARRRDEDRRAGDLAAGDLRQTLALRDQRIKELLRRPVYAPAIVATQACPDPGVVHLSSSAVRLYDTALGGFDQQLRDGARGAAADSSGSCLAGSECEQSEVTVSQFLDVAQLNAERHGKCQAVLSSLVKFIRSRQAASFQTAPGGASK